MNFTSILHISVCEGVAPRDECDRSLLVKQSYLTTSKFLQKCESSRRRARCEKSRVITNDGTVIKTMLDGTIQVCHILHCADGRLVTSRLVIGQRYYKLFIV